MKVVVQATPEGGNFPYGVVRALREFADAVERGDANPTAPYVTEFEVPRRGILTERQSSVLNEIIRYKQANGIVPSLRELCTALNLVSTNGISDHLKALASKGFLKLSAKISRGYQVL